MITEESKTETEILSADEQKLREMCCSLKKIDAPNDFDFKLKARIANTNPRDFQPRFGFAVSYAMPVLALIFVLGLLAYSGGFWSSGDSKIIADNSVGVTNSNLSQNTLASSFSPPEQKINENSAILPSNQDSPKVTEKQLQVAENVPPTPKKDLPENKKDFSGGSKDFSSTSVIPKQPNFNSNSVLPNPQNTEKFTPMSMKDILFFNGIDADLENGKWKVKSVRANTLGESSGIKENDVIEAIDNQPLFSETVNGKTFSGKTITVTRNGVKLQIKLQNKQ